jgi:hypothetical protein
VGSCGRVLRKVIVPLCFCCVPFPRFASAQLISAAKGRVVDAVTGQAVKGISLTLQTSTDEGFSVATEVKSKTTSGQLGAFSLSGFNHPAKTVWDEIRSYWLAVNEGWEASGQEENSAEVRILYDPMSNRRGMPVGDARYFPLTVTFRQEGCSRVWAAACMHMTSSIDMVIPMIPVLDDVKECNRIGNEPLREKCRQLNTYRAAFVHVDFYVEVNKDKELCNAVDHADVSKTCLRQLDLYVANPALGYARPMKPQVNEPTPEGMFPDSIAGLPLMNNGHCGPQLEFDGRVECGAGYGTTAKQLVAVYFEQWPEGSNKPPEWSRVGNQTAVTREVRPGGKVLQYRGKSVSGVQRADGKFLQYEHSINSYVWYSGNTLVEVLFSEPIPEQEKFLSYYLGKFPSTSQ